MRGVKSRKVGSMAEFGPALFVFFLIILFPLINFVGVAMGYGTLYLAATQCATSAGTSASYTDALTASSQTAQRMTSGGFGQFAKMVPVGGVNGSGMDLYILDTDIASKKTMKYGPNTPMPGTANTDTNIYQYQTVLTFNVGPFMNLSAVPFIGNVPGLGVPTRMSAVASYHIENTDGIGGGAAGGGSQTTSGPPTGGSGGGTLPPANGGGGGSGGGGGVILPPPGGGGGPGNGGTNQNE